MLLGADPEMGLVRKSDGKVVAASAAGIPNGKLDPDLRWNLVSGIIVYRDGYGVEFNFDVAHFCRGLMGNAFRNGVEALLEKLGDKYFLTTVPAVPVSIDEIATLPADVAQFGCAPSKNAWGEALDISGVNGLTHPWRYFGGHLWVSNSYDECPWLRTEEGVTQYVRALDYYLGLPFAYIFDRPEAYIRRKMYGRAGDYRTKEFNRFQKGVEYRVLSPEWFNHTCWFSFVLGIARFLSTRFKYIKHAELLERGPAIQRAINTGEGLKEMLPARLFGFYTREGIEACRELPGKFDFQFLTSGDVHKGWDHWSTAYKIPGDWATGSSTNFSLKS